MSLPENSTRLAVRRSRRCRHIQPTNR